MATHSSILAWRMPWAEEPGGLQPIGLQSQTRLKQLSTHTRHMRARKHMVLVSYWFKQIATKGICGQLEMF